MDLETENNEDLSMMVSTDVTRIILADDHAALRLGIRTMIDKENGLNVVDEVSDGEELMKSLDRNSCEMVITDLSMPKMDGLTAIEEIRTKYPHIKIVVLSMHRDRDFFKKAVSRGVQGYVLKSESLESVIEAIRKVKNGKKFFSDELTTFVMDDYATLLESQIGMDLLSQREKEVLLFVARGIPNKKIAEDLNISIRTVEAHRSRIMNKLNLKNVQELVKFAISKGLI